MTCTSWRTLSDLPVELLLMISEYLDYICDLNSMTQVSRRVHQVLAPHLDAQLRGNHRFCSNIWLQNAAEKGNVHGVRRVMEARGDIYEKYGMSNESLICAAENGHSDLVAILVNYGLEPDAPFSQWQGSACRPAGKNLDCSYLIQPLIAACRTGQLAVVEILIGYVINLKDPQATAGLGVCLEQAVQNDHISVMELLLKEGCDPNVKDFLGRNALSQAAKKDLSLVKRLMEAGADPFFPRWASSLFSPLLVALQVGNLPVIEYLLEKGLKSKRRRIPWGNICRDFYETAETHPRAAELLLKFINIERAMKGRPKAIRRYFIEGVVAGGFLPSMKTILHDYHLKDSEKWLCLIKAIEKRQIPMLNLLLENGVRPPSREKILVRAVSSGSTEVVKLLLLVVNKSMAQHDYSAALLSAVKSRNLSMTRLLLKHRTETASVFGVLGPFLEAVSSEDLPMARLFLTWGLSIKSLESLDDYSSAVLKAVHSGDLPMVRLLVKHGLQIESIQMRRSLSLTFSAIAGGSGMLKLLMKKGISLKLADSTNLKVIETALWKIDVAGLKIFLEAGMNANSWSTINYLGNNGAESLPYVAIVATLEEQSVAEGAVDLLLEHGAAIDGFGPPETFGNAPKKTALMKLACSSDHTKNARAMKCRAAKLLLRKGADPFSADINGNTAFRLAVKNGFLGMIKVYLEFFDEQNVPFEKFQDDIWAGVNRSLPCLKGQLSLFFSETSRFLYRHYWRKVHPCPEER
ncbi:hypothetical protein N7462_005150 [Penicillium macrosclerotiorum]|uniref:uncharacterized protein n=1 Tax=Penicillium macrosclerotiorum TaxID=303699 RepID=UPI002548B9BC|nr:uncharacterized protein N7462_005150 [Penicillium macrosclerotiorum]KAJ5690758.1 hypothetical protein N7462_005150 [Penicillium macrosclerotiorum]